MQNKKAALTLVVSVLLIGGALALTQKEQVQDAMATPEKAPTVADGVAATMAADAANAKAAESKLEPIVDSPLLTDAPLKNDFVMGDKNAPVKLVEYASLSCPHCAHFYNDVVPGLKTKYIETGKVAYILRQFPLNEPAMAGAMLVTCVGEKKGAEQYYTFNRVLFDAQDKWAFDANFKDSLKTFAQVGGVSSAEVDACLNNMEREKTILQSRKDAGEILKVDATPYLFLNGHPHKGGQTLEALSTVIDQLLAETK